MNMYENLSKEELIQRIKVLETDLAASVMKNAEIEKMSENLLNQRKINFLNILNEYYSVKYLCRYSRKMMFSTVLNIFTSIRRPKTLWGLNLPRC